MPNALPFVPHAHCMLDNPGLIGFHIAADTLIALAYFSIPFALVVFTKKRPDLRFRVLFWLFATFIMSCGVTHLFSVYTLYHPVYWAEGWAKAFCAGVSLVTAVLLWKILPAAISIPSRAALEEANRKLAGEVKAREAAEQDLKRLNEELELRVEERSKALEETARRVKLLQDRMLHICAWTKRIQDGGQWISFERFMEKYFHLTFTHDMSKEAEDEMLRQLGPLTDSGGSLPGSKN